MSRLAFPYKITFCGTTIVHRNQTLEQEELAFPQETETQADSLIYSSEKAISNCGNTSATFSVSPVTDYDNYPEAFEAWNNAIMAYIGGMSGKLVINGEQYDAVLASYNPRLRPIAGKNRLIIEFSFVIGKLA